MCCARVLCWTSAFVKTILNGASKNPDAVLDYTEGLSISLCRNTSTDGADITSGGRVFHIISGVLVLHSQSDVDIGNLDPSPPGKTHTCMVLTFHLVSN